MGNMHHSYLSDISGSSTEAVLNTTVLSERWVGGGDTDPLPGPQYEDYTILGK